MRFLLSFIALAMLLGCENCKECYLIEESSADVAETYVDQRCDQKIKELESTDLVCGVNDCYYECR